MMYQIIDNVLCELSSSQSMGDAYHSEPELTPAEQREQAYNTEPCVPWDGTMLTVTEAAQRWAYYAAEGRSDKTDALTALIAAAKERIRAQWPDT